MNVPMPIPATWPVVWQLQRGSKSNKMNRLFWLEEIGGIMKQLFKFCKYNL
jgi:hypothetical protein